MKTVSTFKAGPQTVTIKQGPLQDLKPLGPLVAAGKKDGVSFTNNEKCEWFIAYVGKTPVACACALALSTEHVRFKSAYVVPAARGKHIYRKMSDVRMDYCREINFKMASSYAGVMSINQLLRDGFEVVSDGKPEAQYLIKDLTKP